MTRQKGGKKKDRKESQEVPRNRKKKSSKTKDRKDILPEGRRPQTKKRGQTANGKS